ncbi:unnamed protein product [Brassica rapa]|uniref:Uncharacterized protein n=1 Tax=Brassica campestris TaxID=3711 RepID=A0A8D9GM27_BRACM|nr:unnamed protein product [Brassica rapa]CAG7888216.1 unnamed protein product [Brassica rapa]
MSSRGFFNWFKVYGCFNLSKTYSHCWILCSFRTQQQYYLTNASGNFLSSLPCNLKVDVYITSIAYTDSPNRSSLLAYTQISYWRQCRTTIVSFLKCSLCDCIYVESNLQMEQMRLGKTLQAIFS